jgi:hypothetical protein
LRSDLATPATTPSRKNITTISGISNSKDKKRFPMCIVAPD